MTPAPPQADTRPHRTGALILEGINSLIQAAKAKPRGCHTARNIAMAYLIAGKLRFDGLEPL